MTVPAPDQLEYISDADGVTKDFPYPTRFLEKDEVIVALRDADGVDTPQVLNTHYTIAGSSWPTGGTVSFYTAPQAPYKVVRYRMTKAKQTVVLNNTSRNDAPSVELQLDRLAMALQDRNQAIEATKQGLSVETNARKTADAALNASLNAEIEDRENGDKALASLIGQAGPIEVPFFESVVAAKLAVIKPTVRAIQIAGEALPGDASGTALYVDTWNGSLNSFSADDGRTWYRSPDRVKANLGTIVVLGSSTAAGFGTSTFGTGPSAANGWMSGETTWVYLLQQKLGSDARIINASFGGTNTVSSLSRFWRDCAVWKPNIVVLCTGFANEVGVDLPDRVANYIRNTLELCRLVRSIGALPIVQCTQPLNHDSPTAMLTIARALDAYGISRWDFMATAANENCTFKTGLAYDAGHGNDLAHQAYVDSIDIGVLYGGDVEKPPLYLDTTYPTLKVSATTVDRAPVLISSDDEGPLSWTMIAQIKPPLYSGNKLSSLINFNFEGSGDVFRVHTHGGSGNYAVTPYSGTEYVISNIPWDDPRPRTHVVSYNSITKTLKYFIDGTLVGTRTDLTLPRLRQVRIGGSMEASAVSRANDYYIIDFSLFRVSLPDVTGPLTRLLDGELNLGSCLAKPLMGMSPNGSIPNQMRNRTKITTSGVASSRHPIKKAAFSANLTVAQDIASGVATPVKFNSVVSDPYGYYNAATGEFKLPPGQYRISASVRFEVAAGVEAGAQLSIRTSAGSDYGYVQSRAISTTDNLRESLTISRDIQITSGTLSPLGIYVMQATGSNKSIEANYRYNWITVSRIGDL